MTHTQWAQYTGTGPVADGRAETSDTHNGLNTLAEDQKVTEELRLVTHTMGAIHWHRTRR